jgi:hypothetical protein
MENGEEGMEKEEVESRKQKVEREDEEELGIMNDELEIEGKGKIQKAEVESREEEPAARSLGSESSSNKLEAETSKLLVKAQIETPSDHSARTTDVLPPGENDSILKTEVNPESKLDSSNESESDIHSENNDENEEQSQSSEDFESEDIRANAIADESENNPADKIKNSENKTKEPEPQNVTSKPEVPAKPESNKVVQEKVKNIPIKNETKQSNIEKPAEKIGNNEKTEQQKKIEELKKPIPINSNSSSSPNNNKPKEVTPAKREVNPVEKKSEKPVNKPKQQFSWSLLSYILFLIPIIVIILVGYFCYVRNEGGKDCYCDEIRETINKIIP